LCFPSQSWCFNEVPKEAELIGVKTALGGAGSGGRVALTGHKISEENDATRKAWEGLSGHNVDDQNIRPSRSSTNEGSGV
jgi:hypothetical protein